MSHYEERLERDLQEIRSRISAVSELVKSQIRDAVLALLTHDFELANRVILQDRVINRETRALDQRCHGFVVRHLPVAHHLRYISAVLRMDVALERVGDYAVTVCRNSIRCSSPPPPRIARDLELIAQQARDSLTEALRAFNEEDTERARRALGLTRPVDTTHDKVLADLVSAGEQHSQPIQDLFAYLQSIYVLLRVSDQAENMAQETLFAVDGETRNPKTYRILFVDRGNDCRSQIAEAYARKVFHEGGKFSSGGWDPASSLRPEVVSFLDAHGFDPAAFVPKAVPDLIRKPKHFHVVVGLEEGARTGIGEIPFKTIFLDWDMGPCPVGETDPEGTDRLEEVYREIASRLKHLMEILRGPDEI